MGETQGIWRLTITAHGECRIEREPTQEWFPTSVTLPWPALRGLAHVAAAAAGLRVVSEATLTEAALLLAALPDPNMSEAGARSWLNRRNRWLDAETQRLDGQEAGNVRPR